LADRGLLEGDVAGRVEAPLPEDAVEVLRAENFLENRAAILLADLLDRREYHVGGLVAVDRERFRRGVVLGLVLLRELRHRTARVRRVHTAKGGVTVGQVLFSGGGNERQLVASVRDDERAGQADVVHVLGDLRSAGRGRSAEEQRARILGLDAGQQGR